MMNEVNEFEGKGIEIEQLRRLIYTLNQDVKESESVYYQLENIDNPQELSLKHLHNVLNGFRYLNTINLTPFKYAEHARAIEIADRIETSLDALLKSEKIAGESVGLIIAVLNDTKFQNSSRSLQSTKSRLEEKVRLVKERTENSQEIVPSTIARLKPGFFERLIKNIIQYIDRKRTKGPKENDIYNKTDSIKDSYAKYEKEKADAEAARLAAEKETADAIRNASATETLKSTVKDTIVNAKKGLHALGEALHLVSPTTSTEKSEQLKALHEMGQENRDLSQSVPKQIAKKKQTNIAKAERKILKEEAKRKKETPQKLGAPLESKLTPEEPKNPKQEQLTKLQKMGELKDIIPANLVKEKQDKITVERENVERQAEEEKRKQREVEQKLKEQDQQMKAEAKKKKQEQLIKLKEMETLNAKNVANIESVTPSNATEDSSVSETPKDKEDQEADISKPTLQKSPGKRDLKQVTTKPKLQKSEGASDLNKIVLKTAAPNPKSTTVSEKPAGFFAEGEKTKAKKTKRESRKGPKKDTGF